MAALGVAANPIMAVGWMRVDANVSEGIEAVWYGTELTPS
jgi:hypothetical protein